MLQCLTKGESVAHLLNGVKWGSWLFNISLPDIVAGGRLITESSLDELGSGVTDGLEIFESQM